MGTSASPERRYNIPIVKPVEQPKVAPQRKEEKPDVLIPFPDYTKLPQREKVPAVVRR